MMKLWWALRNSHTVAPEPLAHTSKAAKRSASFLSTASSSSDVYFDALEHQAAQPPDAPPTAQEVRDSSAFPVLLRAPADLPYQELLEPPGPGGLPVNTGGRSASQRAQR